MTIDDIDHARRAVRRAEDDLADARRLRRRAVVGMVARTSPVLAAYAALGIGIQAAILDGLNPAPDTRAVYGALCLALGLFGAVIGTIVLVMWLRDGGGSLSRRSDVVRQVKRALRDRRDDLESERTRGHDLADAEDIVARWTPPTS